MKNFKPDSSTLGACALGVGVLNGLGILSCSHVTSQTAANISPGAYVLTGTDNSGSINVKNCLSNHTITCTLTLVSGTITGPWDNMQVKIVNGNCNSSGSISIPFTMTCDNQNSVSYLITGFCSDTTANNPLAGGVGGIAITGLCQ